LDQKRIGPALLPPGGPWGFDPGIMNGRNGRVISLRFYDSGKKARGLFGEFNGGQGAGV